jgi:Phytanoyl-CoA dioxygenase (PhyH)
LKNDEKLANNARKALILKVDKRPQKDHQMRQLEILRKLYRGRAKSKTELLDLNISMPVSETLKELKSSGITFIENFADISAVKIMRNEIDKTLSSLNDAEWNETLSLMQKPENKYGVSQANGCKYWTDKNLSDQRIIYAEKISEQINDFSTNQTLREIGEAYLGMKLDLKFCMANRTRYSANNAGSGGGWHRDDNYKRGYKALLYLVDTDTTNGCFQYLKKSSSIYHHLLKTPVPDKYQFTHEEVLKMIGGNEDEITNATAKAGTVVIFDTNGIHRGRPIEPGGERYALTNYYLD